MAHPLFDRLAQLTRATWLDPQTIEPFEQTSGDAVLVFAGDPVRFPEGLDVAVVLPELLAVFSAEGQGAWRVGIVAREHEDTLARRWGVTRWPSLVFVREGQWLGTVSGMKDWDDYLSELRAVLQSPPKRRPSVGIPLVNAEAASACH